LAQATWAGVGWLAKPPKSRAVPSRAYRDGMASNAGITNAAGAAGASLWLQKLGAHSQPPSLSIAVRPQAELLTGNASAPSRAAPVALGVAAGAVMASGLRGQGQRRRRRKQAVPLVARQQMPSKTEPAAAPVGQYSEAVEKCIRRKTRTVHIGDVKVGSEHPIATQTMANTLTHDVEATVAQIKKCADAGIDIVRVTVQGMKEAKACEHIKRRLLEDGYATPIVADIHFTPKVAMVVADFVDKIRVNPGNFADGRKSFDTIIELTDDDIKQSREAIEEALVPLVLKLKEKNKALRIGVNHGSMAERILIQYGDSPEGMVASAIEFGEICREHDFHNFVFSMKSSNPQVMVQAYRQLAREMYERGWDYPLHLGVTEAGGGADGRIKSAVGIGALLLDGLGDTIRVSLTEDPELEAGPCIALRKTAEAAHGRGVSECFEEVPSRREGRFARRQCEYPLDIPLNADGSVLATIKAEALVDSHNEGLLQHLGLHLRADGDLQQDFKSVDSVVIDGPISKDATKGLRELLNIPIGVLCRPGENVPEGVTLLHNATEVNADLPQRLGGRALVFTGKESREEVEAALRHVRPRMILLRPEQLEGVTFLARRFFATLAAVGEPAPVMLWFRYPKDLGQDGTVVRASADLGSLFVDGLGEGVLWEAASMNGAELREASFNLLQACRMRISKTEFISCPSCGRTLFDLQDTTAKIQARTGHLPGVRIAVMGCIVNGPGEMADADFGYVGSGVGKVDLYVGYDCVKRGIVAEKAVNALVQLIREHGKWVEPNSLSSEDSDDEVEAMGVKLVRDAL